MLNTVAGANPWLWMGTEESSEDRELEPWEVFQQINNIIKVTKVVLY